MTNIAIERFGYRRNLTLAHAPMPEQIDALVRTGHHYDERAQQWYEEMAGVANARQIQSV
jgi:hypothetical protein